MRSSIRRAAAAATLAVAAGLPDLGQQTEIATKPGSGVVKTRDREGYRRKPRQRTPEQVLRHDRKLARRYGRWASGIVCNSCLSQAQKERALGFPAGYLSLGGA